MESRRGKTYDIGRQSSACPVQPVSITAPKHSWSDAVSVKRCGDAPDWTGSWVLSELGHSAGEIRTLGSIRSGAWAGVERL